MTASRGKVGILVGGGPAPGINSVISAASIRASLTGHDVVGIRDGFRWLMKGDLSKTVTLEVADVSRIHFRGGSILGTSRDNPTTEAKHLDAVISSLDSLGIDKLITIGGDDTAFSAMRVEEHAQGRIRVAHVPKTIDNDLDLPHGQFTFGFQTARHVGVEIVKNLMIDAKTTSRWYIIISMGRKAGHLALGIGKAAAATLTVIPEEFPGEKIRLSHVVDIIVGAIIKRRAQGRGDGVAVIAEGIMVRLDAEDLKALKTVGRDAHGHIKLADIQFASVLKSAVKERLKSLGTDVPIATKDIGYELRCHEPIPFDIEYTRDLGFCAAQFLINGGTGALVVTDSGRFHPIYFKDMIDPATKRTRVRMVDIGSEYYHVARRYMLRVHESDLNNKSILAKLAGECNLSPSAFKKEFSYLITDDALTSAHDHVNDTNDPASRQNMMPPF